MVMLLAPDLPLEMESTAGGMAALVAVAVGVTVAVCVEVGVEVAVAVDVGVGVAVGVDVVVGVAVDVLVGVGVGVAVAVEYSTCSAGALLILPSYAQPTLRLPAEPVTMMASELPLTQPGLPTTS
jgi:hypothetical protein